MAIDMSKVTESGLLAELAYLRLESTYFQKKLKGVYSNENIIKYFNATTKNIQEFYNTPINPNGNTYYDSDEIKNKTADKYRDISPEHKGIMLNLLNKYEIIDFESDDLALQSDFQGMLLKEKATGKYVIAFRGTASITDALVDAVISHNFNPQYNEAKEFTEDMIERYDIDKSNLTITGHSLGGILTQQVGATLG